MDPRDSPGIRFPPPLIYVAGFAAGRGLDEALAIPLIPDALTDTSLVLAKVFMAVGMLLILAGLFSFARHRTAIAPSQGASRLITSGLYRFSRNPIYLGFTSMYLGASLRADSLWILLCLPPVLWIMNRHVIGREERHLAAVFGESYSTYCQRVRRWF